MSNETQTPEEGSTLDQEDTIEGILQTLAASPEEIEALTVAAKVYRRLETFAMNTLSTKSDEMNDVTLIVIIGFEIKSNTLARQLEKDARGLSPEGLALARQYLNSRTAFENLVAGTI